MSDPRDEHKPQSPDERRVAIAELRSRGLTARDIASAMRVDLGEVLEAVRTREDERRGRGG